ncbi:unnamed protein product, partial [Ectocarpus fasciculatus]
MAIDFSQATPEDFQTENQEGHEENNDTPDNPDTEDQDTPPEPGTPEGDQPDFGTLTGGRFQSPEELWTSYTELESNKPEYPDEYIKGAVDYYQRTGNLTPYLEATQVDFDKMEDEALMRYDLRKKNPTLSEKAINKLFTDQVTNRFSLDTDEFTEDEVEIGRELMAAEASRLREEHKKTQKEFLAAPKEQNEEKESQKEQLQRQQEEFKGMVEERPEIKALLKDKKLSFALEGQDPHSLNVDNPQALVEAALDSDKFYSAFALPDDQGVDWDRFLKVSAY